MVDTGIAMRIAIPTKPGDNYYPGIQIDYTGENSTGGDKVARFECTGYATVEGGDLDNPLLDMSFLAEITLADGKSATDRQQFRKALLNAISAPFLLPGFIWYIKSLSRNPDHANDTYAGDVNVLAVRLFWTTEEP